jgi:lantibiotic transport system ATP-binding protein
VEAMAIATDGLTRRFGDLVAVNDVSLRVPRGSVYGFLGPNGAGKTTTIRMLLGLIRTNGGEVRLLGEGLGRNKRRLLGRLGSLVESPSLYPHLTGRENLELLRRLVAAERGRIFHVLELMGMTEAADRRVGTYSHGMKQRLGLAAALLNAPELLILDEPTNGLDPAGIREIRTLIRDLPSEEGVTVFLSSHLLNEVDQVASHIGIIQQGELRFQGTLNQLHAEMGQHVVLSVDQPLRAMGLLHDAGWGTSHNGDHQLTVEANGESDVAMINAQLVAQGINIFRINLEQPTLEEIFFNVTETA